MCPLKQFSVCRFVDPHHLNMQLSLVHSFIMELFSVWNGVTNVISTVSPLEVINIFTVVLLQCVIVPRAASPPPQSPGSVYFTTFTALPVHIVERNLVDEYVEEHASALGPPFSSAGGPCGALPPMRCHQLPAIAAQSSLDQCTADIVLSGAGQCWLVVVAPVYLG